MSVPRIRRILEATQVLAEHGFSPEEVKADVVETLEPYFEHKERLEAYAVELLVSDAINASRLRANPACQKTLEAALEIYRRAKSANEQRCFEIIGEWQATVFEGLSKYWSLYQLERALNALEIEEFV